MATQKGLNSNWREFALEKPNRRDKSSTVEQALRPDLRWNVFVSKQGTSTLANIILSEPWGPEYENLYKLIDYTWRAALFNHQIFRFGDKHKQFVVFHSGLQRHMDGEFIYFVLVPNDDESKVQKWRIASSPTAEWSFQTAGDLLQYVDGDRARLPQRTKFYDNLSEILLDPSAIINVDWVRTIESCHERIIKDIVQAVVEFDDPTNGKQMVDDMSAAVKQLRARNYHVPGPGEIRAAFMSAFDKTEKIVRANPGFVVPQGFVDTNKRECRLELLFPLFVEFDVRMGCSEKIQMCFCLALQREPTYNGYKGMSILTAEMAYTNARLVGVVHQSWLLAAAWPELYASPMFTRTQKRHVVPQSAPSLPRVQQTLQQSAPPTAGRFARGWMVEPEKEQSRNRSLFVRNIPRTWTEEMIRGRFSQVGRVNRMTMLPNRKTGSDKLLCLIEMGSASQAVNAIHRFHNEEDEDGLKVERSRGPKNMPAAPASPPKPSTRFPVAGATTGTSVSMPPMLAAQKLTLEVRNVGHDKNATSFLELLKFANVGEDEMLWITVFQPENVARIRFKLANQIERVQHIFSTKAEFGYICRKIRNPPLANNELFWKKEGGEKLSARLSAQLDAAEIGRSFYINPDDRQSPRIVRHSESTGLWHSPDMRTSVPLLRVHISTWRAPSRWKHSRLRRNPYVSDLDEKTIEVRQPLNPNAAVFDPNVEGEEEMEEEANMSGAQFVPHDNNLEICRGSPEWNQLENLVSGVRGLDITSIYEWPLKMMPPRKLGSERHRVWVAGDPEHVRLLETNGFLAKYGTGRGHRKGFTVFNTPNVALTSISDPGASGEVNLILCDAFLSQVEKNYLAQHGSVHVAADTLAGCVDAIIPKYVFNTSQRRVGRSCN